MTSKEINFAYKVRHALNESVENIPHPTVQKLAAARKLALARKKKDLPLQAFFTQKVFATAGSWMGNTKMPLLNGLGLSVPVLVLIAGLVGIYHFEQEQRINELAEIDTAVLSDELPLSAYLDHGFNAYLANRAE